MESNKPKGSNIYIFWSLFAACIIAISGLIRGIESHEPFASKFCLSFWYLVISSLTFIFYSCKEGSKFIYPWLKKENDKYKFSCKQIFAIVCGGASEFVVSLAIMMCYNSAGKGNINQGLGTCIMICDCFIVTLLSCCFFGEKVSCA